MRDNRIPTSIIWAALGMVVFSFFLPAIMENHHFSGDAWSVIAYSNGFNTIEAILQFGWNLFRPGEGVYWILQHKILGFDRHLIHVCSLLLNALGCFAFGVSLYKAFPRFPILATGAMVTAFFLPLLTVTTFLMQADNSRFAPLLFWVAMIMFLLWAERPSRTWWLVAATLVHYLAAVTYETAVFHIAIILLFALPVLARRQIGQDENLEWREAVIRPVIHLSIALGIGAMAFLATRYMLFRGGVLFVTDEFISFSSAWDYIESGFQHLFLPLDHPARGGVDIITGVAIALAVAAVLFASPINGTISYKPTKQNLTAFLESRSYIFLVACVIVLLGVAPFMVVFPANPPSLDISVRFYSSAAFGYAILLVIPIVIFPVPISHILKMALAILAGMNAAFLMEIRHNWEEAADRHCLFWNDFLRQIPKVADNTTFFFLGMDYKHKGVPVFRGNPGLRDFIPILYGADKWEDYSKVTAYHIYRNNNNPSATSARRIKVRRDGLMTYARNPNVPIDPSRLILVERKDDKAIIIDKITREMDFVAADWRDGITEIVTNRFLILQPSFADMANYERLERLSINCR